MINFNIIYKKVAKMIDSGHLLFFSPSYITWHAIEITPFILSHYQFRHIQTIIYFDCKHH